MPSGKQTSFQFGEVAPIQHYRSNDASYSNALHSLHNMHVKRTGGVTRIPGTKLDSINANQDNIPSANSSYQRYKITAFPSKTLILAGEIKILSMHLSSVGTGIISLEVDGVAPGLLSPDLYVIPDEGFSKVNITKTDDRVIIHGLFTKVPDISSILRRVMVVVSLASDGVTPVVEYVQPPGMPDPVTVAESYVEGGSINLSGAAAYPLAVQYMITMEFQDGVEYTLYRFETIDYSSIGVFTGANFANDIVSPGDGMMTGMTFVASILDSDFIKLRRLNVYRADVTPGSASQISSMVLTSRIPIDTTEVATPAVPLASTNRVFSFQDTGASSPLITPPVDISMFTSYEYVGVRYAILEGTSCSCIYQARQIIGFNEFSFSNVNLKPGGMAVTKVGSDFQIARPIISRSTEAFGMSLPVDDGSPVRQLIAAERLVALSDNGTYIIQGGENGILTPTSINPYRIHTEGGSETVSPIIAGANVIYLNSTHTKLMTVVFGPQSQAGAAELSALSDHFLDGDVFIEMHLLPGPDTVVLLLKQSGEIVAVTIDESGVAGFASVDMSGGIVETITTLGLPNQEYLVISTIRNGVRTFETIGSNLKLSSLRPQVYSNSTAVYGALLLEVSEQGYPKVPAMLDSTFDPISLIEYEYLNITTGSDYQAGSTLTITSDTELGAGFTAYDNIKVLYEENGETRYLYLTLLDTGVFTTFWTYTARADIDVPTYLQDVENNGALTAQEKLARSSRWLTAFTRVVGDNPLIGLGALYTLQDTLEVSVVGDNRIYSSPLNPNMHTLSIDDSGVTPVLDIPEPVTYVEIGIPYESYMQTLPIEVGDGRTLTDDKKDCG